MAPLEFEIDGFESYYQHAYKDFFFNKLIFSKIINFSVNQQYYKAFLFLTDFRVPSHWGLKYRVSHTYLTKVILLKMSLKCIAHLKTIHICDHKDPPFDMKHQLMSADQLPVVNFDLK